MQRAVILSVAALLLCIPSLGYGGGQAITPEIELLLKETENGVKHSETGAVILTRDAVMKVGPSGEYTYTAHIIGKVLDSTAANQYSNIYFPFNSYYDDLTLDFARSISPEGIIAVTPVNAIQVKNPGSPGYTDARFLTFAIPALSPGSIFDFQIREKQKVPMIEGAWFCNFNFAYLSLSGRIDPVHLSKFTLVVPEREKFAYETQNIAVEPTVRREGKLETYCWEIRDLPAVKIERDMPSPFRELTPWLRVSSIKTWHQIQEWAAKKILLRIETGPEVRKKAEELVLAAKSRREKIALIFDFVQSHIRYIEADLSSGGHVPHPPADVLRNLFGDCKDQAVLLVSLLRAEEIEAYPALIEPYEGVRYGNVPVPEFTHLIVYVPDPDGELWLDTTSGAADFPVLPFADQGKQAFVIDGKAGRFLTTPFAGPEGNRLEIAVSFEPKDGAFLAGFDVKATGAIGMSVKNRLLASSEDRRKEMLVDLYKRIGYKGTNVSVNYPNIERASAPFIGNGMFRVEKFKIDPQKQFKYSGSVTTLLDLLIGASNVQKPDDRVNDVHFPYQLSGVMEWVCRPPAEKMKLETLSSSRQIDSRFLWFSETYSKEAEVLKVRMEVRLKENKIKKEDYKEFYEDLQKVLHRGDWQAAFSVPVSKLDKFFKNMFPSPRMN